MQIMPFKIKIDDLDLADGEENIDEKTLSYNMIKTIIYSYAQENKGLNDDERREFYKICDVVEKAIKDKSDTIELEESFAKFIRKCKSKCKLMPNKLSQRVEKLIDNIKSKEEDNKEE